MRSALGPPIGQALGMAPLLLAIDAGTTGITALVVTKAAQVVARGYREFPQYFPADGCVEHDLGEMWSATLSATREALDALDVSGLGNRSDLVAVGVTNQRETLCLWDRETLGAPRRAIVWQDRRTAEICRRHEEAGHGDLVRERTGLRLDPYFTATKAQWVREQDAQAWHGVETGQVALGTVDSYLIARMSRGVDHITDATNASRTLLCDIATGAWDTELCDMFGVPASALPSIVPSYGSLARTDPRVFLGLDLPVCGIAGDQQAALIGQAGVTPGSAKCTYGTGSFLLLHTGASAASSRKGLLTTIALKHPGGQLDYALEGAVFVTGSAVQWLRDGLGIIDSAADVEALAASVADSGSVVFVPALTGLGAPQWDPHARGTIIGITRGTTKAHIARATLEAIAFEVADLVDLMREESGLVIDELCVDGGAAANELLMQLQANALHARIDRSAELQTTGLGAALLAGVGAGVWPDLTSIPRASSGIFAPEGSTATDRDLWRRAVERSRNWTSD